ncbi:MAG TPA: DUF5916 domain-containing protein [Gemmatimonadaceae bacterium]|nr:DUF5916 domain-containing protein [Gemmatimonadaceae bacterium]
MRVASLVLLIVAPATLAFAQRATPADTNTRPLPVSVAVRASGPIRIDGRLDEIAWRSAPVTDQFTQIDPEEGKPASQRTEVRVLYDDDALYVGVRLWDSGRITARLGRRDGPLGDSDWFGLMLDSYHDHRTAFGFDVNPAGVKRDEVKTIETDDNSWDAVWDVATSVDSAGWTAEYRVPFSQLRFSRDSAQTWGVQFERIIGRRNEYAVSTFIPKKSSGGVPMYGHLTGLRNIAAGRRLELLPYVVSRAEYVNPGSNPFRTNHEQFADAGLDMRYRVASNLTLNATLNPDFGQVEVDPAVVNLGVYETFFEEKRPFFLEGSEIFDFGLGNTSGGQMFYSRRIGRAPTLFPESPMADVPTQTTILGAAKLSGKVQGWSVGSLAAVTAREESRFRTMTGASTFVDSTATAEPLSQYFVTRARRELNDGRSLIGGAFTAVHRDLDEFTRPFLRSDAIAGGTDFRHEFGNRTWAVSGDAEFSNISGTPESILLVQTASNHFFQRPDALHLAVDSSATSLFGYSTSMTLEKQGGEHWRGSLAAAVTSPGYEVNDLGFSYRTDRRDAQVNLLYLQNKPGKVFRRWLFNNAFRTEHNSAWEPILTGYFPSLDVTTLNYWRFNLTLNRFFHSFDDRLTRGGPIAGRPGWTTLVAQLSSDARKAVTTSAFAAYEWTEAKGWTENAGANVGFKSSTWWNLTIGPNLTRAFVPAQFVSSEADASYTPTYGVRYVFAPLHQTELSMETRLNVTFSPTLSFESYLQPLISAGDYGDARQLVAPRTFDFVPYAGAVPDLDFNLRSLRGNAVLRWEWREGSTLFLAWQQSRFGYAPIGDFAFGRDRSALFATRPDNIYVLKVNYWLNP